MEEERFEKDAELVRLSLAGGPAGRRAFGQLIRTHHQRVIRHLLYLLGSQADAEDVAQESFARAYLKLASLQDPRAFSGWLRRICLNLAFNRRRGRTTNPIDQSVADAELERSNTTEPAIIERDALSKALMRLSYHAREILVLYYVEELSVKEIADTLQLGLSATKMRLSRAREEFQRIYVRRTQ